MFHDVVACSGNCGMVRDGGPGGSWLCDDCADMKDRIKKMSRRKIIETLTVEDIPAPNTSWDDLALFILSFDAIRYWGSFDKMAEVAKDVKSRYKELGSYEGFFINELRTFLYFTQRANRHTNNVPNVKEMEDIYKLIETLRIKV